MDTNEKSKILYAMIALRTEVYCRIICDTADNDYMLQFMVISILYDMKKIESNKMCIKKEKFTIHFMFNELVFVCVTEADNQQAEIDLEYHADCFLQLLQKAYSSEAPPSSDINRSPNAQIWIMMLLNGYNVQCANEVVIKIDNELNNVTTVFNIAIENLIAKSKKINTLIKRIDNLHTTTSTFKSGNPQIAQKVDNLMWKVILWISVIYWIYSLCYIFHTS